MASRSYRPPATFITEDGRWPEGPFRDDAQPYVTVTARLVERLASVMRDRGLSLRAVAGPAGIDPTRLSRLINGKVVPDLATIANLEHSLQVDLWPGCG